MLTYMIDCNQASRSKIGPKYYFIRKKDFFFFIQICVKHTFCIRYQTWSMLKIIILSPAKLILPQIPNS